MYTTTDWSVQNTCVLAMRNRQYANHFPGDIKDWSSRDLRSVRVVRLGILIETEGFIVCRTADGDDVFGVPIGYPGDALTDRPLPGWFALLRRAEYRDQAFL